MWIMYEFPLSYCQDVVVFIFDLVQEEISAKISHDSGEVSETQRILHRIQHLAETISTFPSLEFLLRYSPYAFFFLNRSYRIKEIR